MQAIILVGGLGTRLKGVISDIPKPMAPIKNKPFLQILLDKLNENGFKKVILAVGYKKEIIIDYFNDQYKNIKIVYSCEDEPLGTGGALKQAATLIDEDYFYVFNGDTFFDFDYTKMKTSNNVMIACTTVSDTARYGSIQIEDGRITRFIEKGKISSGLINGGIYLINKQSFISTAPDGKFSLEEDYFKKEIENIVIEPFVVSGYFIDMGIPEDYAKAQEDLG